MLRRAVLRAPLFAIAIAAASTAAYAVDEPSDSRLLWPLEERTCVTGSFGEYRSNHFHAGIDISTGGRIGLPVRAPAAGRVGRLRASPYGYGKVIYIDLDDPERGSEARGRQVVCAHLSDFAPRWRALVEAEQERLGKYTVDFAVPDSPRVEAGEVVAYTGDTGGGPPHLHFEVREGDAAPIDPLTHGWVDRDREPPIVSKVRLVPLGLDGRVATLLKPRMIDVARSAADGTYRPKVATPRIEGRVGVQVLAWDPGAGSCDARRGIKGATLRLGDDVLFDWEIDRSVYDVDFNLIHERYDYESRIGNDRFVRLYDRLTENGAVSFDGDDSLQIEVRDSAGNVSRVIVFLHGVSDNGELARLERAVDAGAPGIWILPPVGTSTLEDRGVLRVDSRITPAGVIFDMGGPSFGTLLVQLGARGPSGEFRTDRSDSIAGERVSGSWLWYAAPASLFEGSWFDKLTASSNAERALRVVWRDDGSSTSAMPADSVLLELSGLESFEAGEDGSLTASGPNGGAKWEWSKGALLGDALVVTSSAVAMPKLSPGLTLHGLPFRAEPMDLPLSKQVALSAVAPPGAVSDPRLLGIFRVWSDGEIEPLSSGDDLSAKTWLLGTFAILEDRALRRSRGSDPRVERRPRRHARNSPSM